MSLSQFNINCSILYAQTSPNNAFGPTAVGPLINSFNLNNLNFGQFNLLLASNVTLAGSGGTTTFDLFSFEDLLNNNQAMGHSLGIFIMPTGADVVLQPGASLPLTWFFGGSTQTVTIPNGGIFLLSNPYNATGQVVDATHRTLKLTNNGGSPSNVYFFVVGGP